MNDASRIARMENQIRTLESQGHDHETRVRDIEKTVWKAFGATAILQTIIVIAIALIKH